MKRQTGRHDGRWTIKVIGLEDGWTAGWTVRQTGRQIGNQARICW